MNLNSKKWTIVEILSIFILVMLIIWGFHKQLAFQIAGGIVLLSVVVLGFVLRKKEGQTLGYYAEKMGLGRWEKWRIVDLDFSQTKNMFICLLASLAVIVGLAVFLGNDFWEGKDFWKKWHNSTLRYIWWGIVQQFLLQGYFTNRLYTIFAKDPSKEDWRGIWATVLVSAIAFAIVHYPNPVLMIATPIFGAMGAYFFLKCRNVYLLGIFHGILGTTISMLLAKHLYDGGMRVGPGFWEA